MRKSGKRSKPSSSPTAAVRAKDWLNVSQIIKVFVGSGALIFLCNLGYDAAKATILRRLQLEAENKQLRTQLERIDHKILPKIEQAHHEVKDIQTPLQQDTLTRAQQENLAVKARGVCETLEEVEHMLKLSTVAKAEAAEEVELADLFIGLPSAAKAATTGDKKRRGGKNGMKKEESIVSEKFGQDDSAEGSRGQQPLKNTPTLRAHREEANNGEFLKIPNPIFVERNLSFLGLPVLPTRRDPADIRRVILQHKASIQDCYTSVLKANPVVSGEIKVRLTIAPSGKVIATAIISSTVDNTQLEQLVLERISRWNDFGEVSPSVGNMTFRQTFILGAGTNILALKNR